jgi:CRISPR-associated endonuclease Csn1
MHKDTVYGEVNLRKIKEVSLAEAIKTPERIVVKDFKHKLQSLLKQGYDTKRVKKYIEENKDTWQDINPSKIKVYYFTKETKDRFLQQENHWTQVLIEKRLKKVSQTQEFRRYYYVI